MVKYATLTQRVRKKRNGKPSRKEWALVSKSRKSKDGKRRVLRWFGPKKPSKERVAEAERIIHSHSGAIDGVVENSADDRKDITDYFNIPTKLPRNLKINIDTKASLSIFDKLEKLSFFLSASNLRKEAANIDDLLPYQKWGDGSPVAERSGRDIVEREPTAGALEAHNLEKEHDSILKKLEGTASLSFISRVNEEVKGELFKILNSWYSEKFGDWDYDTDFNIEDFIHKDENFGFSELDISFIELMHDGLENLNDLNTTEAMGNFMAAREVLPYGHKNIDDDIAEIQIYENTNLTEQGRSAGESRMAARFVRSDMVKKFSDWVQYRGPNFEELYGESIEEIEKVINNNIPELTEFTAEYLNEQIKRIEEILNIAEALRKNIALNGDGKLLSDAEEDSESEISDIGIPLSVHAPEHMQWLDPTHFKEYGERVFEPVELVGGLKELEEAAVPVRSVDEMWYTEDEEHDD
tara:strand:+ start:905 stop:2308 length:1404 start_codon:yes stop_codon:yes gene_type:complete